MKNKLYQSNKGTTKKVSYNGFILYGVLKKEYLVIFLRMIN